MRQVILQMVTSFDGYVNAPDGDLGWIFPGLDAELRGWINDSLAKVDTQLLGRVSFTEQAHYWPTADEELAGVMNASEKVVFSRTLGTLDGAAPEWPNSRLAQGSPAEEIARLKAEPGGDLYVPGGGGFAQHLSSHRLIDEYRVIMLPIVLGGGLPLFKDRLDLTLVDSRAFATGAVVLTYRPA